MTCNSSNVARLLKMYYEVDLQFQRNVPGKTESATTEKKSKSKLSKL